MTVQNSINVLQTLLRFVQDIAFQHVDYNLIEHLKNNGPGEINDIIFKTQKQYE